VTPRACAFIRDLYEGRMIGMDFEKEAVVEVASGPDFQEGVAAFLAKRPPRWHFDN
jgi:enoyl-CoA hydratase/carnithine racemase